MRLSEFGEPHCFFWTSIILWTASVTAFCITLSMEAGGSH
jgi:hypothetical protein